MNTFINIFILYIFIFNQNTITAQCHIDDWYALKALYENTEGDNWINNGGWQEVTGNTQSANCNLEILFGVGLDEQGRLEYLELFSNQLSGIIPPELGNLSNLKLLNLAFNELIGSIPPELGNLANLEYLSLTYNHFNDSSIPTELGNLSKLTHLDLQGNELIGNIPVELGNLTSLIVLWLGNNQLNGSIPTELGNLSNLTYLNLSGNLFNGSVPVELGNLNKLIELLLSYNELSGSMPAELCDLTNLTLLLINNNNLQGCYPDCINTFCSQLTDPFFDGNKDISNNNNFNTTWKNFCDTGQGACFSAEVYPGDLNHDGIVNHVDLGLLGLYKTEIGPPRLEEYQGIDWYAHPAKDWGTKQLNNEDIKHFDCDGNGFIDEDDHPAVLNNMGEIWTAQTPPSIPPQQSDYQVMLHPIDQISGGHFTIDYSNIEGSIDYVILGLKKESWLGYRDNDLWYVITELPSQQKIEIGFTKSNNLNSEGSGIIGDLILSFDNGAARFAETSNEVYEFQVSTIGVHNGTKFTPIEDQLLKIDVSKGNCQPNWTITEDTSFRNEYKSNGTIATNGFVIIGADQQVNYQANLVTLNNDFEVKAGASFRVGYGACD